jgi:hypothetical protein
VPQRLTAFLEPSGFDVANLSNVQACLQYYAAERSLVQADIQALIEQACPITIAVQHQLMQRVAALSTEQTFERLVAEGILIKG